MAGPAKELMGKEQQVPSPRQLVLRAHEHLKSGRCTDAIVDWSAAYEHYIAAGDQVEAARCSGNIGVAYLRLEQWEQAVGHHERAIMLLKDASAPPSMIADQLGNKGVALRQLGEFSRAEAAFQEAASLQRESGNPKGQAQQLGNLANLMRMTGRTQDALRLAREVLGIFESLALREETAIALGNLAAVLQQAGDYAGALLYYRRSLTVSVDLKDVDGQVRVLNNLGTLWRRLGNYAAAQESFRRALGLLEGSSGLARCVLLGNQGELAYAMEDWQQAKEYLEEALAIARQLKHGESIARHLNELGGTCRDLGELDLALAYIREALAVHRSEGNQLGVVYTLGNLSLVYRDYGDVRQALEIQNEAWQLAQGIGAPEALFQILVNRADLYARAGEIALAEHDLLEAIRIAEWLRGSVSLHVFRRDFLQPFILRPYQRLMRLYSLLGRQSDAFIVAESARARLFVEQLGMARLMRPSALDPRIAAEEDSLLDQRNQLERRLAASLGKESAAGYLSDLSAVTSRYEALLSQAEEIAPDYVSLRRGRPIAWNNILRLLRP